MLGKTSYKEAYCFVYKKSKMTFANCYYNAPTASFSRPPYAILMAVKVGTTNKYVWFANIHSIFGKTVGPSLRCGYFFSDVAKYNLLANRHSHQRLSCHYRWGLELERYKQ